MKEGRIEILLPMRPYTKKNSQQIFVSKKSGKRFIHPSTQYTQYAHDCGYFLKPLGINYPINTECRFYLPTRRTSDLTNLIEAVHDILQDYGVIDDDNCRVIVSVDGSRVYYDKENPRTELIITKANPTFPEGGKGKPVKRNVRSGKTGKENK